MKITLKERTPPTNKIKPESEKMYYASSTHSFESRKVVCLTNVVFTDGSWAGISFCPKTGRVIRVCAHSSHNYHLISEYHGQIVIE